MLIAQEAQQRCRRVAAMDGEIERLGNCGGHYGGSLALGYDGGVSILLGNGDRFGDPTSYALGSNGSGGFSLAQSKAAPADAGIFGGGELVADFNRDGRVDIITDDVLLTGQAGGTFSDPTALAAPLPGFREIAVDYDRDGKLDIVSVGDDTDLWTRLCLIRGNGDGSFQQPLA